MCSKLRRWCVTLQQDNQINQSTNSAVGLVSKCGQDNHLTWKTLCCTYWRQKTAENRWKGKISSIIKDHRLQAVNFFAVMTAFWSCIMTSDSGLRTPFYTKEQKKLHHDTWRHFHDTQIAFLLSFVCKVQAKQQSQGKKKAYNNSAIQNFFYSEKIFQENETSGLCINRVEDSVTINRLTQVQTSEV